MIKINSIKMPIDYSDKLLKQKIIKLLRVQQGDIKNIILQKRAIDSRKKEKVHFVLNVYISLFKDEQKVLARLKNDKNISFAKPFDFTLPKGSKKHNQPVVVGFGPAGMFASFVLAVKGLNPIIVERGKQIEKRELDVVSLQKLSILHENSNIQFGEGGAGAFSDGKLTTGIKDKRIGFILKKLVDFGANENILYDAKPHIGTDILKKVVKNCRKEIEKLGGKFMFETQLVDFSVKNNSISSVTLKKADDSTEIIDTDLVILAIGHSARDTFEMLNKKNIVLQQKPFSVGFRIEHLREMIDKNQYGSFYKNKRLGSASYKLSCHTNIDNKGVYTFCMCPGGQVVCASSEKNTVVTNGMSNFARDDINSNSAVLVGVDNKDFKSDKPLAGVEFQRKLEKKAFLLGQGDYFAPIQRVDDFVNNKHTNIIGEVIPSFKPGTNFADLSQLFEDNLTQALREGLSKMDNKINGFVRSDAILTGVESRSSSPVRILRNPDTFSSVSITGLYPIGEGAGYAGGIVSAAVDGVKCCENF